MLNSHVIRNPQSPLLKANGSRVWRVYVPGIALVAGLALASIELAKLAWLQAHGISALTLSIVLGIVTGNTVYPHLAAGSAKGVAFSKHWLLRAGIVLYGLRLTYHDIAQVGMVGVLIDALVLMSTFGMAYYVGTRLFKLDPKAVMLIGAGSAICGAAAVMATEPVLRGRSEQVCVAVATVVVFGTIGMFLYPALFDLNVHHPLVAMTPTHFGIYAGSTIHEVAQVVAAGRSVSDAAANTAVITKMVRVMMLAPFLMGLSAYMARRASATETATESKTRGKIVVPWFALGFVAVAAFNSLNLLPSTVVSTAVILDTVILAMAMAALGLTTQASAIKTAGMKPLALAAILFAWLIIGGFAINAAAMSVFAAR